MFINYKFLFIFNGDQVDPTGKKVAAFLPFLLLLSYRYRAEVETSITTVQKYSEFKTVHVLEFTEVTKWGAICAD